MCNWPGGPNEIANYLTPPPPEVEHVVHDDWCECGCDATAPCDRPGCIHCDFKVESGEDG